jgi:purine-cytosine permease-like protein
MGLSISVVGIWLAKVPRLIWPIVITAIYIPIAIAGANSFSSSLENFMNVLGYWLSIFVVVVLLEVRALTAPTTTSTCSISC